MNTANVGNSQRPKNTARTAAPAKAPAGPVRGYIKLQDATRAFNFDFRGKVVLDIGSSTGGFTQLALDRGARQVIAVEKGTNQMMTPLRHDPRVELHEKTDIFTVKLQTPQRQGQTARPEVELPQAPDIIVADISFLSLTKVLMYAKINLSRPGTQFLVMLKPQFEARPDQLEKGIVKNEKIRRDIIKKFELWLKSNGFIVVNKRDNILSGKHGNIERFYWLALADK